MLHIRSTEMYALLMPRAALIVSELLMGIAAVGGGLAILAGAMDHWLPIAWLQDSPFADYRLPALALIALVGGGNCVAAILLLVRQQWGIIVSIAAGGFLIAFEIVEVATMGLRMWLQPFCFILGVIIVGLALRLRATGRTAGWVSR